MKIEVKTTEEILEITGLCRKFFYMVAGNFDKWFVSGSVDSDSYNKGADLVEFKKNVRRQNQGFYSNSSHTLFMETYTKGMDERIFHLGGIDESVEPIEEHRLVHTDVDSCSVFVMNQDRFGSGFKFMMLGKRSWIEKLIKERGYYYLEDMWFSSNKNMHNGKNKLTSYTDEDGILYLDLDDYERRIHQFITIEGFWGEY